MGPILRTLGTALAMALGTMFVGWWTVPVIAVIHAAMRRESRAPMDCAVAALLAWGVLLARYATSPAFAKLLVVLGGIFPVPGVGVLVVTVVFAMVLAWSGARVVGGVVGVGRV